MSLTVLPYDLLCLIVASLDNDDRQSLACVSRLTYRVSTCEEMWRLRYIQKRESFRKFRLGPSFILPTKTRSTYQEQCRVDELLEPFRIPGYYQLCNVQSAMMILKVHHRKFEQMNPYINPGPYQQLMHRKVVNFNYIHNLHFVRISGDSYMISEDVVITFMETRVDDRMYYRAKVYESNHVAGLYAHRCYPHERTKRGCVYYLSLDELEKYIAEVRAHGGVPLNNCSGLVIKDKQLLRYFTIID